MTNRTEPSDRPPDSNVFRLDEYGRAGQAFVADAVKAIASANSPILAMIAVEKVEAIAVSRNTLNDGQILDHEPHKVESTLTMSISDGIAGEFDDVHVAIAQMADEYAAQLVPSMLSQLSDICDATGNVVSGAGRPFWDTYLESLETIALSFEPDGTVTLPTMAVSDKADIPPPPDDFEARANAIVERRRDEWMAARRTRRLPRDRQ